MKKVHWTQTPEGKKRLSEVVKKSYARGGRKRRQPVKKATKQQMDLALKIARDNWDAPNDVQRVALDAIPDRAPPVKPLHKERVDKAVKVVLDTRAELALALVKLVAQLTQETK